MLGDLLYVQPYSLLAPLVPQGDQAIQQILRQALPLPQLVHRPHRQGSLQVPQKDHLGLREEYHPAHHFLGNRADVVVT